MSRRLCLLGILVLLGRVPAEATAQGSSPEGLRGGWHVHSADGAGRGVVTIGITTMAHGRTDSLNDDHQFSITALHWGYGLSEFAEFGLSLPLRAWWTSAPASRIAPSSSVGLGDVLAGFKLQLPIPGHTLRLGTAARVSLPTGSRSRGWSSETTDFEWDGLLTLDFTRSESFLPVRVYANGGYRWNRNDADGVGLAPLENIAAGGFWPPAYPAVPRGFTPGFNDAVPLGLGLEFSTRILVLFSELTLELHPDLDLPAWQHNPMQWTQGAVIQFRNGIDLRAAVDISLQRDAPPPTLPEIPDWRFALGFTWRTELSFGDDDHDGIADDLDACRDQAEDYDGFQDEDGCPDPDNDADGVPDRRDLAPDLPEDFDGFEDGDGRPDRDNDGDGIRDEADACPNAAEDFDGEADADGCPEEA